MFFPFNSRSEEFLYLAGTEAPVLGDQIHQGERHCESAQEHVRHSQVGDEDVSGGQHHLHSIARRYRQYGTKINDAIV